MRQLHGFGLCRTSKTQKAAKEEAQKMGGGIKKPERASQTTPDILLKFTDVIAK